MGGISGELPLSAERIIQSSDHFIEGARESPYFIIRKAHIESLAQVLGADSARRAGQPIDRRKGAASEEDTAAASNYQSERVRHCDDDKQGTEG